MSPTAISLGTFLLLVVRPSGTKARECGASFDVFEDKDYSGFAKFDLQSLKLKRTWYIFRDKVTEQQRNYTYALNVCQQLSDRPSMVCSGKPLSTAYQYDNRGECFYLGSNYAEANATWSLIDKLSPQKGVKLKYSGGEYCPGNSKSRSLTITFPCNNRDNAMQDDDIVVEEKDCDYFINFQPSSAACPTDCPLVSDTVCGVHGFCDYNTDMRKFSCFCDDGWWGETCENQGSQSFDAQTEGSPGCDGVCVALIFVFLLLLGLIVAAVIILLRVRKMNELNVRFAALAEDLNPDGEDTFELQDASQADDRGVEGLVDG
mmetsp:Transcript_22797/g.55361  ORF Transcript_22797/g.55361 Transcript_22797/m.55361 type:complete len:318 (-) Transcript_22797:192-1145(-)